jgi:hypothetical protein
MLRGRHLKLGRIPTNAAVAAFDPSGATVFGERRSA